MAYIAPIIIAAAEQKKQQEEEESLMAEFIKQDPSGDWEYKIIRGTLGSFGSEARMRRALEAESNASWELAMKLDDERMLLRRPRSASRFDETLGPDARPYRTDYGGKTILIVVAVLLLILGVASFGWIAFAGGEGLTSGFAAEGYPVIMFGIMGILVLLGLLVVGLKLRR
jgi:hypothetical protein